MLRSARPARLAATVLLAAAVCACGQQDKLLDADQIEREVHALASLSAEAAFFWSLSRFDCSTFFSDALSQRAS